MIWVEVTSENGVPSMDLVNLGLVRRIRFTQKSDEAQIEFSNGDKSLVFGEEAIKNLHYALDISRTILGGT